MCCARMTRLRLELNLDVIETPLRRQNTSGGYKTSDKIKKPDGIRINSVFPGWR